MQGQEQGLADWRRMGNAACMRRLRASRKRRGVPEKRAVADALLAVLLARRPATLHVVEGPLIDAGFDEGEVRYVIQELVRLAESEIEARADVRTPTQPSKT